MSLHERNATPRNRLKRSVANIALLVHSAIELWLTVLLSLDLSRQGEAGHPAAEILSRCAAVAAVLALDSVLDVGDAPRADGATDLLARRDRLGLFAQSAKQAG